jgi:hypothetical protein
MNGTSSVPGPFGTFPEGTECKMPFHSLAERSLPGIQNKTKNYLRSSETVRQGKHGMPYWMHSTETFLADISRTTIRLPMAGHTRPDKLCTWMYRGRNNGTFQDCTEYSPGHIDRRGKRGNGKNDFARYAYPQGIYRTIEGLSFGRNTLWDSRSM